jgi:LacI family transcriptional regulator
VDRRRTPPEPGTASSASEPRDPPEGKRRATINDIARLAGVSKKTVSRIINNSPAVKEETRLKVNAIIEEHGYAPDPQARGLAFRRSFLVGMIYDQPNPQYVVDMQQGVLEALRGSGCELVVHPCSRTNPAFLNDIKTFVESQRLFGVVLPPSTSEDDRLIELLDRLGCRYVRIASVSLSEPHAMLVTHDDAGAAEAARHLAQLGHTRIAHISGPASFRSAHIRREGFVKGLKEHGLALEPRYSVEGGYTFDSGVKCGAALLALKPRPTAIFTGNDEMAIGVFKAARDLGLEIPRDLSVVGYDDSPMASRVWPYLTTVRLPIRDMGRMAAEKLLAQDSGERPAPKDETEVRPSLVVRDSSGPPPP